ncbi:helix-turn-helix transcriptional regulator [Methanocella paludicola]|nr:hypothetical protein [Methanocella paludicola]
MSLVLLCALSLAAPTLAQSTVVKVELFPNGDARWTTEKVFSLDTQEDIIEWDAIAAQGRDKYLAEFEARMKDYVARISGTIGRAMAVNDVEVSVEKNQPYAMLDNTSRSYGVIRYEFTWTGFAMTGGDSLEVGDSFVDGFLLSEGDSISFTLPSGYEIDSISPDQYDYKKSYQPQVKWSVDVTNDTVSDVMLFQSGEPSIIMQKTASAAFAIEWWMLIPAMAVSAALGFGAAYLFMNRRPRPVEAPPVPDLIMPDAGTAEPEVLPVPDEGRFLSDEERIVRYLEEAGGQMFQSDLVRKTDFSKSKLSMVLSDLKEKGTIIKIKKGKENLIRLNRPPAEGPKE